MSKPWLYPKPDDGWESGYHRVCNKLEDAKDQITQMKVFIAILIVALVVAIGAGI